MSRLQAEVEPNIARSAVPIVYHAVFHSPCSFDTDAGLEAHARQRGHSASARLAMAAVANAAPGLAGLAPAPEDAALPMHDSDGEPPAAPFDDVRQFPPTVPRFIVRQPATPDIDDLSATSIALGGMESTLKRLGRTSTDVSFLQLNYCDLNKKMSM